MVNFAGGNGETVEEAVIILNAGNHQDGVRAEYEYIAQKYGQPHVDWQLRGQGLIHHEGKPYDQMNFVLSDGTEKTLYFDISDFFGKGLGNLMANAKARRKSPVQRLIDFVKRFFGG